MFLVKGTRILRLGSMSLAWSFCPLEPRQGPKTGAVCGAVASPALAWPKLEVERPGDSRPLGDGCSRAWVCTACAEQN